MKKKQIAHWCTEDRKLPVTYNHKYYRCKCGKRLRVQSYLDWEDAYYKLDARTGKKYLKLDTLWKYVNPHKIKVKYKNEN